MANVEIIARETVKSLDELRRMPIGEPFAGLINGLTSVFLLKIEEHKGDNYSFLTLPMYQMHQVDILSRDIEFFDLDMLGTIRPLFPQEKTRITTYLKDSIDYNHLQDKVLNNLQAKLRKEMDLFEKDIYVLKTDFNKKLVSYLGIN